MPDFDAIVIGAGHNGLTCAAYLARAGWKVLVLERLNDVGGALRTAEVTLPGFKNDLFATNLSFFAASPVCRDFAREFAEAGLRFLANRSPYASVYANGTAARMYMDAEAVAREMRAWSDQDLRGWRRVLDLYRRTSPFILPLFYARIPSADMVRRLAGLAITHPLDALAITRVTGQSSLQFAEQFFASPEIRDLLTPWGFHLDFGPTVRGGGMFAFLAGISAHAKGLCVAEGGAGMVGSALQHVVERHGGTIALGKEVVQIQIVNGRAVAVRTSGGDLFEAKHAVIANVTPRLLFGRLVPEAQLPSNFIRRIGKFRYGPGTFVVHLALSGKLDWRAAGDLSDFNYVHACASSDEMKTAYRQSLAGILPARPLLVVSQTTPIDPSRAPPGGHIARIHVRAVPAKIKNDAKGDIPHSEWPAVKEYFADRVIDLVAEHAPNIKNVIIGRHVVSPEDLEAENPNLVGGDCVSGSHHLDQNYLWRPIGGWSRYATPIKGLYMIGASTWPGGGVNAGSGYLLAQQLCR